MSDNGFKAMAFSFKVRDFLRPRKAIVKEIGLKEGFRVLDYGCGPGGYVPAVAELIGPSGKMYALDINPTAVKMTKELAAKKQLSNVETILSGCDTHLSDESMDVVLLYDVFHDLTKPNEILEELHRVLKANGILSFSDHHLKENEILSRITNGSLFKLQSRGKRTYNFVKTAPDKQEQSRE
jgi:ubiquinone/menaquinone biosynthesis C-methylase UbiE